MGTWFLKIKMTPLAFLGRVAVTQVLVHALSEVVCSMLRKFGFAGKGHAVVFPLYSPFFFFFLNVNNAVNHFGPSEQGQHLENSGASKWKILVSD